MSSLKTDAIEAATGTNTNLALTGKGTGKVALGDAALLVPDADGAAGQILTTDGSLALTFAATPGSSGNVLTSNGSAWTSAAAAGGGSWNIIGTVEASDDATLTVTGLDSTYGIYAIGLSQILNENDNSTPQMSIGESGGILTASNYSSNQINMKSDSATVTGSSHAGNGHWDLQLGLSSDVTGQTWGGMYFLTCLAGVFPRMYGQSSGSETNNHAAGATFFGSYLAVATITQVQFWMQAENVTSGRMTVWGIAHA